MTPSRAWSSSNAKGCFRPQAIRRRLFHFRRQSEINNRFLPFAWIITRCGRSIIRPVREVLRHISSDRRTGFQTLLAPRHKRTPVSAIVECGEQFATNQSRVVCADENRLATIMSFLGLRTAFGEFCRKSLCSEVCVCMSGYAQPGPFFSLLSRLARIERRPASRRSMQQDDTSPRPSHHMKCSGTSLVVVLMYVFRESCRQHKDT